MDMERTKEKLHIWNVRKKSCILSCEDTVSGGGLVVDENLAWRGNLLLHR